MRDVMPTVATLIAQVRRRQQSLVALQALSAGAAALSAVIVFAWALGTRGAAVWTAAALAGLAIAGVIVWRGCRGLTAGHVAQAIERRASGLENLLVTAVELADRDVHPIIAHEVRRQAETRARAVVPAQIVELGRTAAVTAVVGAGALLVSWVVATTTLTGPMLAAAADGAHVATDTLSSAMTVTITPPAYTALPARTVHDVADIEVLEGSRIRLEVETGAATVQLVEAGHEPIAFTRADARHVVDIVAERTRFLLLRFSGEAAPADRLLAVLVAPDAAPVVRIRQPARDLVFPEPKGRVTIDVEATDDLALAELSLRYTRVFGSGESLTFQEGELPLRVERTAAGQWRAQSEISLEALRLEDGDTLVYRATTRDRRPGRDPSASEAYLLEVGKLAEVASAGFALPDDKERQAISQQMLIVKTERLHAERDKLPPEEFHDRSRLLAIEQRMVRAEFIFMTGGEVRDEIEEAEHSHDLAEGRFENEGQVELLTAIREMSRAEARLNDAATAPALEFERAALKALQRAFDRRRYLLRTMPERARIDQTRRLTGTLTEAQSWRRNASEARGDGELARLEALARDLTAARAGGVTLGALAARLGALDPGAGDVQKAALRLAAATGDERRAVIDDTLRLLAERARAALAPARAWVPADEDAGHYADAARKGAKP